MRDLTKKLALGLMAVLTASHVWAAPDKAKFPDISQADLNAAIKAKKVTVIDCNGTESFKSGHIPGAIDFEAKGDQLGRILPKDKNAMIVAYCGGPQCHAYEKAAESMKAMGYRNVKHFSPGISGWVASKQPVEKK